MSAGSDATSRTGQWALFTALLAASWLVSGAIELLMSTFVAALRCEEIDWKTFPAHLAGFWGLHAALTPALVWALRRVPFERGRAARAVSWCVVMLFLYIPVHLILRYAWLSLTVWRRMLDLPTFLESPYLVPVFINGTIFVFLVTAGAVNAWEFYLRYRERAGAAAALELERANLRVSLSEARLEVLQGQLQPHFLFNALHALSTLVLRGETQSANEMLSHLSRFLRMTLDNAETPTVPLAVELEFLEAYLCIQRARFGDRLHVTLQIDDRARFIAVPNLIFQPLVENAIRHGIASDPGQGRISIRARVENSTLTLEVEDNGTGLPPGNAAPEGIGLGNIRRRLDQLYPGKHSFALGEGAAGGTLARVTIPAHAGTEMPEVDGYGR